MPAIFVTATGTEVGKTYVAAALARALRGRVDVLKPVLSGFDGFEGSDAERLMTAAGLTESEFDRVTPWRYAAPLAPSSAARLEGQRIEHQDLVALCVARMAEAGDVVLIIEGAGGIMSPLAEGATNLDLMADIGAPAILVTGSYLGAISHTLTAIEAMKSRKVALAAIVVSESAGEVPPLSEITTALATFAAAPVVVCPRDGAPDGLVATLGL